MDETVFTIIYFIVCLSRLLLISYQLPAFMVNVTVQDYHGIFGSVMQLPDIPINFKCQMTQM